MEKVTTFLGKHVWLHIVLAVLCASTVIMLIDPGDSALAVVLRVAVMSIGAVIVLLMVRRKEKRAAGGSTTSLLSLDRKLRMGEVPTEKAEQEAMRDLVEQRLHRSRHRVTATAFLALLCASLVAMTAVTSGVRQTLGFALLFAIFIGWLIANGTLQNRRLRRMRDALDATHAEPRAGAELPSDHS
ncbi:hypothetical protein [Streptomyces sp. NPDC008141]|uniref:hypothetical protein n=1 Tax=Streptomyces sp. NPDC008141 TaxID=3364815 RepID=UPI0036F07884